MERIIHLKTQDVWRNEEFANVFGFQRFEGGFTKEVSGSEYLFREISEADDLKKVLKVQKKAWGWKDIEVAPVHILALLQDTGAGVFGAYDQKGEIVGFAAGLGSSKPDPITGKPMLISSMLAVADKNLRSNGIGRELKTVQAFSAYQNGYPSMKWLYDPERGANAYLNISKLGAMAEEFYIDKYGYMASGLYGKKVPTDRFRAVWRFTEPATVDKMLGISNSEVNVDDLPIATDTYLPDSDKVLVQISSDIDAIKDEDAKIKRRYSLRKVLSNYFLDKKYVASDFISKVNADGRNNYYLLEPLSKVIENGRITL